jgi:glutaconate CoA-transferase, subunit A
MVTTASRSIGILAEGEGSYQPVDPDGFREYVREHKARGLTPKVMSAQEAVARFVANGDYLVYDCEYLNRGPNSLLREVIRQRKRDLWVCGRFTYVDLGLLVAAGCASRADCGFLSPSRPVQHALAAGRLAIYEYSNVVLTLRLQAGAMGVPFLPLRSFGGTTGFEHSGAKLIRDPYTGQPTVIVPALNPDVALIHVQQADVYGNARVFGAGIAHVESALASKKVVISAEEIIDTEEIRRNPGLTSIPYYAVDAVVEAPFGCYPGNCPGVYGPDPAGVTEVFGATRGGSAEQYLQKWVYDFETDRDMINNLVAPSTLIELRRHEVIREGYR